MEDLSMIQKIIKEFYPFAKKRFGFEKPPRLFLKRDASNAANLLGKTAYYDPSQMEIVIYVNGRHPKDILRSFAHELVHHKQNCEGCFDGGVGNMGKGYAQSNEYMREKEKEAYLYGSLCVRDYTDLLDVKGQENLI